MTIVTDSALGIIPSGGALAADIVGVDLARLDDASFEAIHRAWLEHLVLRFRGRVYDDATHMAFARRFGELDYNPGTRLAGKVYIPGFPEMGRISNVKEDGKPIGELGNAEADWHTDMCFVEVPPALSILRAVELPPSGGDTYWANMYQAYETLPADVRARLDGLTIKHDGVYDSYGVQRPGTKLPESGDFRDADGAVHPLVRTHPLTGRKALYLGRRLHAWIPGLEAAESEALLDMLWDHAMQPALVWRQQWQVGDVIIWDNRCTMHRRDSFDPASRRIMHRTVVRGERPV